MKQSGTLNLITDGGERKMHYVVKGDKIITLTDPKTNKVKQIQANPEVTIDLDDNVYIATLIEGDAAQEYIDDFVNSINFFQKIIKKFVGAKYPMAIILEKK